MATILQAVRLRDIYPNARINANNDIEVEGFEDNGKPVVFGEYTPDHSEIAGVGSIQFAYGLDGAPPDTEGFNADTPVAGIALDYNTVRKGLLTISELLVDANPALNQFKEVLLRFLASEQLLGTKAAEDDRFSLLTPVDPAVPQSALSAKQDVLTETVEYFLPAGGGTLPVGLLGKSVYTFHASAPLVLPTPTMADLGKIVRIESASGSQGLLRVSFVAPGTSGGPYGAQPASDKPLAILQPRTSLVCQVLSTPRNTPYNDVIAGWVITSLDTSQVAQQSGTAPLFKAAANGAQSVPLGLLADDILSVTCLEAATQTVRTIWPLYYSIVASNVQLNALAGIKNGDSIVVKYLYRLS